MYDLKFNMTKILILFPEHLIQLLNYLICRRFLDINTSKTKLSIEQIKTKLQF